MPDAPKRMSPERIELIRKKADECGLFDRAFTTSEVAYLLAEIDALRIDCNALAAERDALARHGGGA